MTILVDLQGRVCVPVCVKIGEEATPHTFGIEGDPVTVTEECHQIEPRFDCIYVMVGIRCVHVYAASCFFAPFRFSSAMIN